MTKSAFPILTFDEWTLTPSLGYAFDPACLGPYESLVSMLWKFAWANRLPGHTVVSHTAKSTIDPYDGITVTLEDINTIRIASTLHITLKSLRLSTHRADSGRLWCHDLRFCSRCMARGYHSVVHQFEGLQRCPIHKTVLETRCRSCGKATRYHLNAKLIDAPFGCAQCGSRHSHGPTCICKRSPLLQQDRTAITRTFLG